MSTRVVMGALVLGSAFALASACGSSSNKSGAGGTGGSAGAAASGGTGATAGGPSDAAGGSSTKDVNMDAPFVLPDGGCGQILCPAAVADHCYASLNDCAQFCEEIAQSSCQTQWNAVVTCMGSSPQLTCADGGPILVQGCLTQEQAVKACLSSG
jgi:hypothetical protein